MQPESQTDHNNVEKPQGYVEKEEDAADREQSVEIVWDYIAVRYVLSNLRARADTYLG